MKPIIFILLFLLAGQSISAQSWTTLADSARQLAAAKKNTEAITVYKQVLLQLEKDSSGSLTAASINDNIGELALGLQDFKMAIPFLQAALAIREKQSGTENLDYAATANNLGSAYTALGSPELALPLLLSALATREKILGTDNTEYANTCDNLGIAYFRLTKYAEAGPLIIKARDIRERKLGKLHIDYLNSTINLANVYRGLGNNDMAMDLYEEVREQAVLSIGKDNPVYLRSTLNKATILFGMGQYAAAEPLLAEVHALNEKNKINNPLTRGLCSFYLGQVYATVARYSEAQPLLEEAKQIAVTSFTKTHFLYYFSANALGQLYIALAQFEKAEENLLEARSIIGKVLGKENYDYALSSKGLAQLYFNQSLNDKALPYAEEALAISRKTSGDKSIAYAEACMVCGILYYNTQDYSKSGEFLTTGRQIFEKVYGKNTSHYAESSYYLGRTFVKSGQWALAEPALLEAKAYAEQSMLGTHNRTYAELCEQLAILYWNKNDRASAATYLTTASYVQQEEMKKYFLISNEKEQYAYTRRLNRFLNLYYSFIQTMPDSTDGPDAYRLCLQNRNTVLSSSRQLRNIISEANDPTLQQKYEAWIATREELAARGNGLSADSTKWLEKKAAQQEQELARLSAAFRNRQQLEESNWEAIQKQLQPGEAAVEFVSFLYFNGRNWTDTVGYSAIVLRKDQQPVVVALCFQPALLAILDQRSIDKEHTIDQHYASTQLPQLIWQPLEKYLQDISTVYFAPSWLLHQVSFAALPLNEQQTLSDKYKLEQLFSTASIINMEDNKITASDKIAVYGGISYNADAGSLQTAASRYRNGRTTRSATGSFTPLGDFQQFPPLPNSEIELNSIVAAAKAKKLQTISFKGAAANEESVKAFNGASSPAVLHFATHGFFFPDPVASNKTVTNTFFSSDDPLFRSGLILAGAENTWKGKAVAGVEDGILTAYEVADLYLPNTKLVVLSACETGTGEIRENEGLFGLQRSFRVAGAQNLITSLWELDDVAASEFMKFFYQHLFNDKGISESFHLAQAAMKTKYPGKAHLWAGFVLIR